MATTSAAGGRHANTPHGVPSTTRRVGVRPCRGGTGRARRRGGCRGRSPAAASAGSGAGRRRRTAPAAGSGRAPSPSPARPGGSPTPRSRRRRRPASSSCSRRRRSAARGRAAHAEDGVDAAGEVAANAVVERAGRGGARRTRRARRRAGGAARGGRPSALDAQQSDRCVAAGEGELERQLVEAVGAWGRRAAGCRRRAGRAVSRWRAPRPCDDVVRSTSCPRRSTPPRRSSARRELAVEVGGGEVGVLEHAVDHGADARAARHRRQRERDRREPRRGRRRVRPRPTRRRGRCSSSVDPGDLGLARRPPAPWPPTSGRCTTPDATTRRSHGRRPHRERGGGASPAAPSGWRRVPVVRSTLIVPGARRRSPRAGRRPRSRRAHVAARRRSASSSAANSSRASGDSAAVPRAGPVQDGLVAGPGERHVREAQRLALHLGDVLLEVSGDSRDAGSPPTSIVRRPPAVGVVEQRQLVRRGSTAAATGTGSRRPGTRGPCSGGS